MEINIDPRDELHMAVTYSLLVGVKRDYLAMLTELDKIGWPCGHISPRTDPPLLMRDKYFSNYIISALLEQGGSEYVGNRSPMGPSGEGDGAQFA